jgi:hypothetical protein
MEHRWDDMVNDIHIMVTRIKEQNKGELPPDLNLIDQRFQQHVEISRKKKNSIITFELLEIAMEIFFGSL